MMYYLLLTKDAAKVGMMVTLGPQFIILFVLKMLLLMIAKHLIGIVMLLMLLMNKLVQILLVAHSSLLLETLRLLRYILTGLGRKNWRGGFNILRRGAIFTPPLYIDL